MGRSGKIGQKGKKEEIIGRKEGTVGEGRRDNGREEGITGGKKG